MKTIFFIITCCLFFIGIRPQSQEDEDLAAEVTFSGDTSDEEVENVTFDFEDEEEVERLLNSSLLKISHDDPDSPTAGTGDTTTDSLVEQLGFEKLNGNCKGATMGRQMEVPVEQCAQLCAQNKFCAGFSYSEESQTCYLKERQCDEPDTAHSYRFYKKCKYF